MSNTSSSSPSSESLCAMLDYLQHEVQMAKTVEDINAILTVLKAMFTEPATVNAVCGLPNIRAEMRSNAPSQDYNVSTNVPISLISTFYELSDKLNHLQVEDPESFGNASRALSWLAGDRPRTTD